MPILDENGRLFGRVNVVDAVTLLLVVLLVPLGVATYRVFRMPAPEIVRIDPDALRVGGGRVLRLEGRNLRPYLRAYVAVAGQAPSFVDLPTNPNEAVFLLERPTLAEVRVPVVAPGAYDLYLYDESREVVRRPSAFTMVSADANGPEAPVENAVLEAVIRFDVDESVASVMHVGDADLAGASGTGPFATVIALRRLPPPDRGASFGISPDGALSVALSRPLVRVETVVRVRVAKTLGVWLHGTRPIRAGETFTFATSAWFANGFITRISLAPGPAAEKRGDR
jgi:hypothetical protein